MKKNFGKGLKVAAVAGGLGLASLLPGCDDATIASKNISKAADNFEIMRRIVFFNGITDKYLMSIEGRCNIVADTQDDQLEVTCKVGETIDHVKKHYFGLSDNTAYFVEQMEPAKVSLYHHRITFKPQAILPDFDFRGSVRDNPLRPQ